jgi:hypothetical protein
MPSREVSPAGAGDGKVFFPWLVKPFTGKELEVICRQDCIQALAQITGIRPPHFHGSGTLRFYVNGVHIPWYNTYYIRYIPEVLMEPKLCENLP